jgi:hypothetical protein
VTKPRDERPGLQMPRNSARFGDFWTFILQILRICVTMSPKYNKAAERAQLNEADMETRKAPGRSGGSTRARRRGRTGEAKEKTPLGVRASP